jgi:hypothetical protein
MSTFEFIIRVSVLNSFCCSFSNVARESPVTNAGGFFELIAYVLWFPSWRVKQATARCYPRKTVAGFLGFLFKIH